MPDRQVATAFAFLLDAPLFESWSTGPDGAQFDIVLSDRVLKYRTFDDVVHAMRAQRRSALSPRISYTGDAARAVHAAIEHSYVALARLRELRAVSSKKWDITRLVSICEELNGAFEREAFITCSMLVRSIVDHVPPIFSCKTFREVANNYAGSKSFRASMQHLDRSLRNHADGNLHTQIRQKESLPTRTQVAFWADLDKLLEETIRILKDDTP
jgi:hypothetical protein